MLPKSHRVALCSSPSHNILFPVISRLLLNHCHGEHEGLCVNQGMSEAQGGLRRNIPMHSPAQRIQFLPRDVRLHVRRPPDPWIASRTLTRLQGTERSLASGLNAPPNYRFGGFRDR